MGKVFIFEYYMKKVEEFLVFDVDVIMIKDMVGLLIFWKVYEFVSEIKEIYGVFVNVYIYFIMGMVVVIYFKVVEVGVDFIDIVISLLVFGIVQFGIQMIWYVFFKVVGFYFDCELIYEVLCYFKKFLEEKYWGLFYKEVLMVNFYVFKYQVLGGMFFNFLSQFKEMNVLDKFDEVFEEILCVREDFGWLLFVIFISQIVGIQVVLNVFFGRYERVIQQVKDYVKGFYGRLLVEINFEIKKKILGDEEFIMVRLVDFFEFMFEKCRKEFEERGYSLIEEDFLIYCFFLQVVLEFFEVRKEGRKVLEVLFIVQKFKFYVDGVEFEVGIEGVDLSVFRYLFQMVSVGVVIFVF